MSFYKYTNISTAALVIKNKSLRWSSPVIFNDLEECQFTPFTKEQHINAQKRYFEVLIECAKGESSYDFNKFSDITKLTIQAIRYSMRKDTFETKEILEFMLNSSNNPETDYREFINKAFIKCFRVLCVTGKCDNTLMWAHYADQHYGCIIEFDKFYTKKPRLLREGYVRYHENLEPRSNPLDMLLYGETEDVRDLMIRDVAFSKRTFWEYEEEYRFMFSESFGEVTTTVNLQTNKKDIKVNNQSDTLFTDIDFPKDSLKSIIFGVRTTEKDMKQILKSLSENDYKCNVYQIKMIDGCMIKEELDILNFQFNNQGLL